MAMSATTTARKLRRNYARPTWAGSISSLLRDSSWPSDRFIMTAFGAIDSGIESIRPTRLITKSFKLEELAIFLQRAFEQVDLKVNHRAEARPEGSKLCPRRRGRARMNCRRMTQARRRGRGRGRGRAGAIGFSTEKPGSPSYVTTSSFSWRLAGQRRSCGRRGLLPQRFWRRLHSGQTGGHRPGRYASRA